MYKYAVTLITALAAVFVSVPCRTIAQGREVIPDFNYVTVQAEGSVTTAPDLAEIVLGVQTEAETAEEAMKSQSEILEEVQAALSGCGVEDKDIRTSAVNLFPKYDYDQDGAIVGYRQITNLTVTGQPVDLVGTLISECTKAGVNEISQIRYFSSGYDEAYDEAMKQALENAAHKAGILAASAGEELGEAIIIEEGWQDTSARYKTMDNAGVSFYAEEAYDEDVAYMSAGIMPGETEIKAQVTVTYRIFPTE